MKKINNKKKFLIFLIFTTTLFLSVNYHNSLKTTNNKKIIKRIKRSPVKNNWCPLDGKVLFPKIQVPEIDLERAKQKIITKWTEVIEESKQIYLQKINELANFKTTWIDLEIEKLAFQEIAQKNTLHQIIGNIKNNIYQKHLQNLKNAKIVLEKITEIIPKFITLQIPKQNQESLYKYKEKLHNFYQNIIDKINFFEIENQKIINKHFTNLELNLKNKINQLIASLNEKHQKIKTMIIEIKEKIDLLDHNVEPIPEIMREFEFDNLKEMVVEFMIYQKKFENFIQQIVAKNINNDQKTNEINLLNDALCQLLISNN